MLYQSLVAVAEHYALCLHLLLAGPCAPSSSRSNAPGLQRKPRRGEENYRLPVATDRQAILNTGTAVGNRPLEICWHGAAVRQCS